MKIKNIVILIIFILLMEFTINKSIANEETYPIYNFYIKKNAIVLNNTQDILLADSVNEKLLTNNKIAPGTCGKFIVNINILNGVISKYNLEFINISDKFPENIKFYFNGAEIDLKTFSLTDIQSSKVISYEFEWKWMYETEKDNILTGDLKDTDSSKWEDLSINISLTAEFEKINKKDIEILPRSGDILTNF